MNFQLGLSKDGGKIWFHHGLQDFIEYYSICVGYFLVFEYEKRSKFHVIILDTDNFEICYPYNFEELKKEENLIYHDEVEKGEDYRNQKGSANLDSSRPRHERKMPSRNCKMKELVQVKTDTVDNGDDEHLTQISDLCNLKALLEEKRIFINRNYNFSLAKERDRLFTLARSLKPINLSFMIVLCHSHIKSHTVYLLAKFTNKYLTRDAKRIKV